MPRPWRYFDTFPDEEEEEEVEPPQEKMHYVNVNLVSGKDLRYAFYKEECPDEDTEKAAQDYVKKIVELEPGSFMIDRRGSAFARDHVTNIVIEEGNRYYRRGSRWMV